MGNRLPFFRSSDNSGEGGGVAFCPVFFWGESSITGVNGDSKGAGRGGGVSGMPMKEEETGVLGKDPTLTCKENM